MNGLLKPHAVQSVVLALVVALGWGPVRAALIDTTTQGSWVGVYGNDGYILCDFAVNSDNAHNSPAANSNDVTSLPWYIASYVYGAGAQQYMWENATGETRAVQDPAAPGGTRKAATSFDGDDFFVDFVASQPGTFQLAVYALDWDNFDGGRSIILNVPGDSAALSSFQDGKWAVFDIHLPTPQTFRLDVIDNQPSGSNNTISAILFAGYTPVPEPSAATVLLTLGLFRLWRGGRRRAGQGR
ncbi:MAG: hypothetical protein BWZ02_02682 [Lentisphaerae bacterium ADurb.BinA184]|nr:MAG: hypothetical protein BWZ02_02682 [Lentisphaerae bacterium ADurb.BinA184]